MSVIEMLRQRSKIKACRGPSQRDEGEQDACRRQEFAGVHGVPFRVAFDSGDSSRRGKLVIVGSAPRSIKMKGFDRR